MKEKKFTPLMWCHLLLMAILIISGAVLAILYLVGIMGPEDLTIRVILACRDLLCSASLAFGVVYLWQGYGKKAALIYRIFILMSALSGIVGGLLINLLSLQRTWIMLILIVVRTIVLIIFALGKDLGKRNTWIIFGILLCVDLAFGFLFVPDQSAIFSRVISTLFRLFCDGTIGLAIRGKYADKEARGTK